MSQLYVKIFMPALPATFIYQLQGRYLQNQGIIWPQVITGAIGNVINALINYIFLYVLDLGVAGSAGANVISQFILMVLLFGYIHWKKLHKDTWAGWTTECLQEWGDFVRLAIPSMLMLCIEWWTYEIGGFLAGISVAASVRVGNALGAGNTEEAKTTSKVAMMGAGERPLSKHRCVCSAVGYNNCIFEGPGRLHLHHGSALVRAGVQTLRDGRENEVHVNRIDSADPSPDSKAEEEMAMEDLSPSHTDTEWLGDGRAEGSMSPVGGILSLQQLVLRRGLAVIGGLLILAVGIIVNVTLTEFTWHSNSTVSPDTGSNATQHRF
ncbi:UNVERIFIED_CONTAM: hypothetical protein FKN15_048015 [Acipenser sinensis]